MTPASSEAISTPHRVTVALILIWTLSITIVIAIIEIFVTSLAFYMGLSPARVDQLFSNASTIALAGMIVACISGGFLGDLIGRKPVLVVAALLVPAGIVLLNVSRNVPTFLIAYTLLEVGLVVAAAMTLTLLFESASPQRRVGALSGRMFLSSLGSMMVILMNSIIESIFFANSRLESNLWLMVHSLFWGCAVLSTLGAIGLLFIRETRPIIIAPTPDAIRQPGRGSRLAALFASFVAFPAASIVVGYFAFYVLLENFQEPYSNASIIITRNGVDFSQLMHSAIGNIYAAMTIGAFAVFLAPFVLRWAGAWRAIAAFAALAIAGMILFALSPTLKFAFAGLIMTVGGAIATEVLLILAIFEHAGERHRGLAGGSLSAISSIGTVGTVVLGNLLAPRFPFIIFQNARLYLAFAALMLIAAIGAVWAVRQAPTPTSPTTSPLPSSTAPGDLIIEVHDL